MHLGAAGGDVTVRVGAGVAVGDGHVGIGAKALDVDIHVAGAQARQQTRWVGRMDDQVRTRKEVAGGVEQPDGTVDVQRHGDPLQPALRQAEGVQGDLR